MKKLLSKTLKPFTIYALIVLLASIPAYYYLVDKIWLRELDEHNDIIATKIEKELNKLNLSETELSQSITLWNKIQPGTNLRKITSSIIKSDSSYTISKINPYKKNEYNRFRSLSRTIQIKGKFYQILVETNVEETKETVLAIAAITFLFYLILVIGFLLLNRRLSVRLWKPFRNTLTQLKIFNLNNEAKIIFEKSDTLEFEELNITLNKLIEHTISVYKSQKEFTENASHELQTPLAIIQSKLDLLLQNEGLTERQYQLIEEINKALTRISRINKNLLLLAKIENLQFEENEKINISLLIHQCLELVKEHSNQKNINIEIKIENNLIIEGNKTLIEILINNLLLNAIRHNQPNGEIKIYLTKNQLIISNSGNQTLHTENIFNRFSNPSGESSGTGLGLAIIKEICIRHQWTIRYQFETNFHYFSINF